MVFRIWVQRLGIWGLRVSVPRNSRVCKSTRFKFGFRRNHSAILLVHFGCTGVYIKCRSLPDRNDDNSKLQSQAAQANKAQQL